MAAVAGEAEEEAGVVAMAAVVVEEVSTVPAVEIPVAAAPVETGKTDFCVTSLGKSLP